MTLHDPFKWLPTTARLACSAEDLVLVMFLVMFASTASC